MRTRPTLLVLALAAAAACAQTTRPAPTRPLPSELNFDQIGLADAIDFFRDATGGNFVVDWKTLQAVGVDRNTPVSLRLRRVTVRVGLKATLDAAAPGLLAFYVDENVIHITTQAVADTRMVTRIYAVADLMSDIPEYTDAPSMGLANSSSGGRSGGGGGSGGGNLFGGQSGGTSTTPTKTPAQRADDLIATLQSTVRPEIWDVNGGPARMRYSAGRLIVIAPASVQDLIGGR